MTSAPINLKHRITGAVLLIGAAVLALPPLFENAAPPAPESTPSFPASPPSLSTSPPPLPEPAPPLSTSAPPLSTSVPSLSTSVPSLSTSPPPASESAPSPPAQDRWIVRTGAFKRADNAHRMRAEIRERGFEAWVERGGGDLAWKVWVGSFASRAEAAEVRRKLCAANGGECDYFVARRR